MTNSHVLSYICQQNTGKQTCLRELGQRKAEMKPIGILIKEELERQERSVSWLAKKLSCDRSNIYRLFQKESIDTKLLQRISIILNRNFFQELYEQTEFKR